MRYHARLKAKKDKAVKQLFSKEENEQIPIHRPFKKIQKLPTVHFLDIGQLWHGNY